MKATNIVVEARENESADRLIRRFIKNVKISGILDEVRARRHHRSNADKRRAKEERAQALRAKDARKDRQKKTFKSVITPKPQKQAKNED